MDHHELYEEAKRLTRLHAQAVTSSDGIVARDLQSGAAQRGETIHVLPGRVYVLLSDHVILGVFAVKERVYEEAYAVMHVYGGTWTALGDQLWRSETRLLVISAHDVR